MNSPVWKCDVGIRCSPAGVLVIHEYQAVLVFLENLHHVGATQVKVRGIGSEVKKPGIGLLHAPVHLFRSLHHFIQVVVKTRLKAHLTGGFANQIEPLTHGLKPGVQVLPRLHAAGRKHHQMMRAEALQEPHGFAGFFN